MDSISLFPILDKNEDFLKSTIGEGFDIKYRHLTVPAFGHLDALLVYIGGLADARAIDETVIVPLMNYSRLPKDKYQVRGVDKIPILMQYGIFTSALKETRLLNEVCDAVLEGNAVLFLQQCSMALILSTQKYSTRAVSEPQTESEIKGPKDSFVEDIQTNAGLIRRRVKDYGLRFESMKIGERTKTEVALVYIDGIVNEALLEEARKRLRRIKIDGILASTYIEELIEDSPASIFPLITNTERPDKASAMLLEGRVVILTDTTPFAMILPVNFWQFIQSSGDYYEKYLTSTFIRVIRFIALFLSTSLSPIYVLLVSFHQEMLPTELALKAAAGRSGVPFPAVFEALLMEITLEIMKEAGLRLPKAIGSTVTIVGTLVIGQSAVQAGLVSPLMVIIIAVAAISSYAIPSFEMNNTLRIIRFSLLFSTAIFGLFGYLAGVVAILLHMMSLRSFGSPYLIPVILFITNGNNDVIIRAPWWSMLKRPRLGRPKNKVRQTKGQKPKPPSKG
jgi:hypothetical protein